MRCRRVARCSSLIVEKLSTHLSPLSLRRGEGTGEELSFRFSHKSRRSSRFLRLQPRNLSRRSSAKADLPRRSLANGANGMSDMAGKAARVRGRAQRELPRYKAGARERESDRHSLTACPTQPVPT